MDWRLAVMVSFAVLIMLWYGTDGYLRIRSARRVGAREAPGATSARHAYVVGVCRIIAAVGFPIFVIAYILGADMLWAVAGPPVVLLACGLVEWGTTRRVVGQEGPQSGDVTQERLRG